MCKSTSPNLRPPAIEWARLVYNHIIRGSMSPVEKHFLEDIEREGYSDHHGSRSKTRREKWTENLKTMILGALLALIVFMEFILILKDAPICLSRVKDAQEFLLYSPAQDIVEYQIQTHYSNVDEYSFSPFWKPLSPELDQQWEDLYYFGVSKIPKAQAALLPNKTAAIPGDEQNYIAELDVFHELHCLNMIRQALYPDIYPDMRMNNPDKPDLNWHIGHCLDSIRQSLMCSADISVLVWQWSEQFQVTVEHGNVTHTCRNFEKIQDWAREHHFSGHFDPTINIEDDIVIPAYY